MSKCEKIFFPKHDYIEGYPNGHSDKRTADLDCEKSLFFFRFSESHAREREPRDA